MILVLKKSHRQPVPPPIIRQFSQVFDLNHMITKRGGKKHRKSGICSRRSKNPCKQKETDMWLTSTMVKFMIANTKPSSFLLLSVSYFFCFNEKYRDTQAEKTAPNFEGEETQGIAKLKVSNPCLSKNITKASILLAKHTFFLLYRLIFVTLYLSRQKGIFVFDLSNFSLAQKQKITSVAAERGRVMFTLVQ